MYDECGIQFSIIVHLTIIFPKQSSSLVTKQNKELNVKKTRKSLNEVLESASLGVICLKKVGDKCNRSDELKLAAKSAIKRFKIGHNVAISEMLCCVGISQVSGKSLKVRFCQKESLNKVLTFLAKALHQCKM